MRTPEKIFFEIDDITYEANIVIHHHRDSVGDSPSGHFTVIDEIKILGIIDNQGTLIAPTDEMIEIINMKASDKV